MTRVSPTESGSVRPKRAAVRKSEILSTMDQAVPTDGRSLPLDALDMPPPQPELEVVNRLSKDDAAFEKFMEELVLIHVPQTGIEGDLPIVEVGVNGRKVLIPRGVTVRVKRKYVEVLLRAVQSHYRQTLSQDLNGIQTDLVESASQTYPVSLVDDTPTGKKWWADVQKSSV
mgnify:CR=1 FL=1